MQEKKNIVLFSPCLLARSLGRRLLLAALANMVCPSPLLELAREPAHSPASLLDAAGGCFSPSRPWFVSHLLVQWIRRQQHKRVNKQICERLKAYSFKCPCYLSQCPVVFWCCFLLIVPASALLKMVRCHRRCLDKHVKMTRQLSSHQSAQAFSPSPAHNSQCECTCEWRETSGKIAHATQYTRERRQLSKSQS